MNLAQEAELERVAFVTERDGPEAAKAWALSTMKIYRQAVMQNGKTYIDKDGNKNEKKKHFASTREYKAKFIQSYLVLKRVAFKEE